MPFVTIKDEDGLNLGHLQTDALERLGIHNLLHVCDQKPTGTDGGTFTSGAWRSRTLNTVERNNIAGASLVSNQIILPAGTYHVSAKAPALAVSSHQARLQAVAPLAATLATGTPSNSPVTNGSVVFSEIEKTITLAEQTTIELQHICFATKADVGFGPGYNLGQAHNIFSVVKIWKVA